MPDSQTKPPVLKPPPTPPRVEPPQTQSLPDTESRPPPSALDGERPVTSRRPAAPRWPESESLEVAQPPTRIEPKQAEVGETPRPGEAVPSFPRKLPNSSRPISGLSAARPGASNVASEALEPGTQSGTASQTTRHTRVPIYQWPFWLVARIWDFASLLTLLALVAAIPLIQLASLGYLLTAGANLANRRPWRDSFPGLRCAGKLGTFALLSAVSYFPVYFVTDLAYSAQLLEPNTAFAARWRTGAFLVSGLWLLYLGWAAMRGGRWWHFLWPAPLRFVTQFWRPSNWSRASDQLYELVASLQIPQAVVAGSPRCGWQLALDHFPSFADDYRTARGRFWPSRSSWVCWCRADDCPVLLPAVPADPDGKFQFVCFDI